MRPSGPHIQVDRLEAPIAPERIKDIYALWRQIFDARDEDFRNCYAGEEAEHNRDIVYTARIRGQLVGTVHLTISRLDPRLGGLGGVATAPGSRGLGMATRLSSAARDDFHSEGGDALFLGTRNPAARRIYARCGWQGLRNADVMVHLAGDDTPEAFLKAYFAPAGRASVLEGTPAGRVGVVPLIVSAYPWRVMDANADILSRRWAYHRSCMGLFPRYEALRRHGDGTWFDAQTEAGAIVGLGSAHVMPDGTCQVDAFAHPSHHGVCESVLRRCLDFARARQAGEATAHLCPADTDKVCLFHGLGFTRNGTGPDFHA